MTRGVLRRAYRTMGAEQHFAIMHREVFGYVRVGCGIWCA